MGDGESSMYTSCEFIKDEQQREVEYCALRYHSPVDVLEDPSEG